MSDDEGDEHLAANIRSMLKVIRDPSKTAYDLLPTGETIGAFANRHAVETYVRKNVIKREKAREIRKRGRSDRKQGGKKKVKTS